jgi:hypothetical protein
MIADKLAELVDEFRLVFTGRSNVVDSILPPLLFVLLNTLLGLEYAIGGSLLLVLVLLGLRLVRGQPLQYALGGLAGVLVAVLVSWLLGSAEGYFLPGILSGAGTVLVALLSLAVRRPLVAWTSYLARRWPLEWYWHPRVRPAYSEVTWMWALFFALRTLLQFLVLRNESLQLVALTNFVTGWPATIGLLVVSYLYGTWRLRNLGGPSVQEFREGAEPPWQGQRKGF